MNPSISVLFRAIPLAMGAVCLAFGLYVLSGGDDADHFVSMVLVHYSYVYRHRCVYFGTFT